MQMDKNHQKYPPDICVRNYIYLGGIRTLSSEDLKKIKDLRNRTARRIYFPIEWVQANH